MQEVGIQSRFIHQRKKDVIVRFIVRKTFVWVRYNGIVYINFLNSIPSANGFNVNDSFL
jgi:hypothetical protein